MSESPKRLIDAWTLEQAEAAAAEHVCGATQVVQAARDANAGRTMEAATILRLVLEDCRDIRLLFLGFQFFFRTGDYSTAEKLTLRRLSIAECAAETADLARACTNLGLIHLTTSRLDSARALCERALTIDERLGNKQGIARDLGNLANVYEAMGAFETAEQLNHRSLATALEIDDHMIAAGKLANLGDIARATSRLEQARVYWREAAALFRKVDETTLAMKYETLANDAA